MNANSSPSIKNSGNRYHGLGFSNRFRRVTLGRAMGRVFRHQVGKRHDDYQFRRRTGRRRSGYSRLHAGGARGEINQRQTVWAAHAHVNQAQFVPEWIRALSAPQSPAEYVEQIAWHYGQGGPQVFFGDIAFYSGEWDARDRVGHIDTNRCRLFMLTGEYDYSCTVELSEATAAKIPGVRFQAMQGIGHFPFAENPKRFAEYLLPILAELKGWPRSARIFQHEYGP
jgi:pimeloyl-ACP methyl ester carboxylesterase